jgi:hypothetical protein
MHAKKTNVNMCIYCGKVYDHIIPHLKSCEPEYLLKKKRFLTPFSSVQIKTSMAAANRAKLMNLNRKKKMPPPPQSPTPLSDDDNGDNELDELEMQLPQKRLINRLIGIANQYDDLEKKFSELHAFIAKKRPKKIDIVSYLNQYEHAPKFALADLVDHIPVEMEDIDFLFSHSVQDTIGRLFSKGLYFWEQAPILAFQKKPAALYAFENNSWASFTNAQITQLLTKLQFQLSKKLTEWKLVHQKGGGLSEHKCIRYDRVVSKLMAPNLNALTVQKKYFQLIFANIKKRVIREIEIEF